MLSSQLMDLSIIIVSYNTRDITLNCLRSIVTQVRDVKYEIIIIDNASSDDSVEKIRIEFPSVKIIRNNRNLGFGKANNIGVTHGTGKYILLLNSDTIILAGNMCSLLDLFSRNHWLGAVGCQVLNPDYSVQDSVYHFPTFLCEYLRFSLWIIKFFPNIVYSRNRMLEWDRKSQRIVDCVSGCFILTSKEIIEQYSLFDEKFFMSYEDVDFCLRLKKNGKEVMYYPDYKIIHYWGKSRGGDVANRTSYESMLIYYRKNKGFCQMLLLESLIILSWFLLLIAFTFISIFVNNAKVNKKKALLWELFISGFSHRLTSY